MSNKPSLLISCIDHRFYPEALALLDRKYGDFDLITTAGAAKNLTSPKHKSDQHALLENIALSIKLHRVSTAILANHLDCGAYGGGKKFTSRKKEIEFHKKDLNKARLVLKNKFPKLRVKLIILARGPKDKISIIE